MIRALIFDLGGVLVPLDYAAATAALQKVSPLTAEEIGKRIMNSGLVEPFETGKLTPEEFYRRLSDVLGLKVSYEEFVNLWSALFPARTLIPDEFLAQMHQRYRLVLLSNTNPIHFEYIRRNYTVLSHFDAFVLSYRVGVMKPAPEIFQAAISAAGCAPAECFYTDDDQRNVEAARLLGLDAERFESFEQLVAALRRRELHVPVMLPRGL